MAFIKSDFAMNSSGFSTAPRIWTYTSVDVLATQEAADYFLDVIDEIRSGDMVYLLDTTTPAAKIVRFDTLTTPDSVLTAAVTV